LLLALSPRSFDVYVTFILICHCRQLYCCFWLLYDFFFYFFSLIFLFLLFADAFLLAFAAYFHAPLI